MTGCTKLGEQAALVIAWLIRYGSGVLCVGKDGRMNEADLNVLRAEVEESHRPKEATPEQIREWGSTEEDHYLFQQLARRIESMTWDRDEWKRLSLVQVARMQALVADVEALNQRLRDANSALTQAEAAAGWSA